MINKFRGDQSILEPGLVSLEEMTGVPTVAVLPYLEGLWIDAEDSLQSHVGASVGPSTAALGTQRLRVAAIRLPRVSNATDVEALACEPGVTVTWTVDPDAVAEADLVVIPGSKATISDLRWLRDQGLADAVCARRGPVVGICGGYQMMCASLVDPIESGSSEPVAGLGLFDVDITFQPDKTLIRHDGGAYEVHHGRVTRTTENPWIGDEGSARDNLRGTHRHGHMENDAARREFLRWVADYCNKDGFVLSTDTSFAVQREQQLDMIADAIEAAWDIGQLLGDMRYQH